MMDTAERILRDFATIAVVGLSRDPRKAAQAIPAKMQEAGFRVVPVSPFGGVLLGEQAYAKLRLGGWPAEISG